jgi:RNA polymerase sigma-70 factor (ECF subfamily)
MKREITPRRPQPEPPQERPSFADVYNEGAVYVWRTLRRLGVADADCSDATQEVFVIVHRRLPQYEPRSRLLGWLAAITSNVAAQYRDRDRRKPRTDGEVDPADLAEMSQLPPFDLEDAVATRELVLYLLQAVEPDRRLVLIMHHIDEMLTREIADALGLPQGTVETRLRLARQDFKAAWARYEARMRHETRSAPLLLIFGPLTLLEAERDLPPLPEGMHERIWSRLQHLQPVGGGGGGGGGGAPPTAPPGPALGGARAVTLTGTKAALALAGTFVLGLAVGAAWDPLHPARAPDATRAAAIVTTQSAAPSSAPRTTPPSGTTWAPVESASTATPVPDGATERALMNKATVARAAGDTAGALAAVEEHARRFHGGGVLAETREAVWISTLLDAGRIDEARARIERYGRLYPTSPRLAGFREAASASP